MDLFMKYVIANLKMNLVTAKECDAYLEKLKQSFAVAAIPSDVKLIVCPSPFFMERFAKQLPDSVWLGGQDVFSEIKGSFTGEISIASYQDVSTKAVICGHSERRLYAQKTDDDIARTAELVVKNDIVAIVCIGETQKEREDDQTTEVIGNQVQTVLDKISEEYVDRLIFAYEPRWAIGGTTVPTVQEIMQIRIVIQKILIKKYGVEKASCVRILYGGSVNASLVDDVCLQPDMDGVLVGRESLDPHELIKIITAVGNKK